MKVRGEYRGIPGHWFNGDERFVATPYGWSKIRELIKMRAMFICERCWGLASEGEVHHLKGRGMGGAIRDDRLEHLQWLCRACHRKEHNQ